MSKRPPMPAVIGVVLGAAIAVALSVLVVANSDPVVEGPMTYLPVVAAVMLPAVLGAIGLRRPAALLAAGTISLPLSMLSLAGATLPLLIPAVFYFVGYDSAAGRQSRAPVYVVALLGLALGAATLVPMFAVGTESVCSKTIRYRNGQTETVRVSSSDAETLSPLVGGGHEIAAECSQVYASWAGLLSVGIAASGVLLITYSSSSKASSDRLRSA